MLARSQYAAKHKIDFSLRGVPVVSRFVERDAEMQELERHLLDAARAADRRNVAVVHGLGGIGKMQLAVEFARKHKSIFSGIFWLDGSSEASVKQSFVGMALRLPRGELTADGAAMLKSAVIDVDMAVRECLHWLSLPSNNRWLLIIDNVDRDHRDLGDSQAYNVKEYFPQADHGSILITSRLTTLQRLGAGVKIGTVEPEQARAILESNAGKTITDAAVVLDLLHGLPLALTQAGSYMRETNVSASTYVQYYKKTWGQLMKEYGHRSVLTTWTMSYEQVQRQSEATAWLLKLWGYLDSGELWFELIAAAIDASEEINVPAWLHEMAKDRLEFVEAAGLLCRYSLIDGKEGTEGYSMHAVLHQWCSQLAGHEERHELCCVAAGLVAANVPIQSDAEHWTKRKRLLAHGISVSKWISEEHVDADKSTKAFLQPWNYYNLGYLLADEDWQRAVKLYERALQGYEETWGKEHTLTLDTVHNLGVLYTDLGQHKEAEKLLEQALEGYEKVWGKEHTSTLPTVNNLGNLYADLGQHKEAEKMYKRALEGKEKVWGEGHKETLNTVYNLGVLYLNLGQHKEAEKLFERVLEGYTKAVGPERISTYVPALITICARGSLSVSLGRVEEAEAWYSKALSGYEAVFGAEHSKCQPLRNCLAALEKAKTKSSPSIGTESVQGGEEPSNIRDAVIYPGQIQKA